VKQVEAQPRHARRTFQRGAKGLNFIGAIKPTHTQRAPRLAHQSLPCPSLTLVIESAVWRDLNVLRENSAGWATICAISNSENYRANRELREHDQLRFRVDARVCALRFWRGFPGMECSTRRLVWDADIESDERIKVVRPSGTWGRGQAQIGRETRRWNRIRRTWFAMD